MTGITTYLSILTLNINRLNSQIKRHCLENWIKKVTPTICCLEDINLIDKNDYQANGPPKTSRSSNTYLRQSRLQAYIDQMRKRRTLHTNKRWNTPKGNNNYQPVYTQCQCTPFHQTYSEGPKSIYRLEYSGSRL
jgi:hypothetical protein